MLDYPQFKLPEFVCQSFHYQLLDRTYLEDVICTALNFIFFHRALGPIELNHMRCERLPKITQLRCGEPQVDQDIKKLIDNINNDPNMIKCQSLQISLKFMEEQPKSLLQFFKPKLKVFEEWLLSFQFGLSSLDKTQDDFTLMMNNIIDVANANYDHFDEQFDQSQQKPLKYQYELTFNLQ
ncbi:unnamed protein product (macronuclear) [Paramecium tetraurelia]|uniref:Autophagy-related protein 101 n=1 Tax=Paramecium tetraurelia TaxID=5888 RepID=A0CYM7_PARTE|nr:uncharacterized protein GSPATT00011495001 [Paramecium tetraurelia]CAK75894.1 unnamed protein product [Paramecium tetraurelia]|eukprot:XP_001443291.1 hypothetical protein (macronuclear) [Paramecium tetraurelia strain d4-2]